MASDSGGVLSSGLPGQVPFAARKGRHVGRCVLPARGHPVNVAVSVIDGVRGRPAVGMSVRLDRAAGGGWAPQATERTADDGEINGWLDAAPLTPGTYQLEFDTDGYFSILGLPAFYPAITVRFRVPDPDLAPCLSLHLTPFTYCVIRRHLWMR